MSGRSGWVSSSILLLPAAAFFVAFALGPMAAAVYISFLDWDGVSVPGWAGLGNWVRAFTDSVTLHSLFLTVQVMVLSWLIQTPVSLLLGVFLAGYQRYRALLGAFYFLPLLFSAVAIGLIWSSSMLSADGALNTFLRSVGLGFLAQDWLGNPDLALYAVIAVIAWQFIPFHTLLYQAGARQIPPVLYEAARIDGAGTLQQFFYITLPQLKYTVVTSTVLILTGSLTYFDVIYVMTGGGPGFATRVLPLHMYITAFQNAEIGYGSAIAVILAVAGIALSLVLIRITGFGRMESQAEGL
ncbi:ABC transporter [Rubrobacter xylanophilus]|uniref:ABC transporter n=1 Tax=Rubrobacter xylanophilus TaxID=49319 RepID=A0A510HLM2_9ACTN|nr:sugar ABC transporter permease [Rubrobacter xylanophilus]BBL80921.1 ABC transporter [Rubrobacter xylanophilus]